jgi:hypothetical protein
MHSKILTLVVLHVREISELREPVKRVIKFTSLMLLTVKLRHARINEAIEMLFIVLFNGFATV